MNRINAVKSLDRDKVLSAIDWMNSPESPFLLTRQLAVYVFDLINEGNSLAEVSTQVTHANKEQLLARAGSQERRIEQVLQHLGMSLDSIDPKIKTDVVVGIPIAAVSEGIEAGAAVA